MRVSLININLSAQDAIGQCILHQRRFHRRRGDEVRIYVQHPNQVPDEDVAADVRVVTPADLLARRDDYFRTSDLYVYHYPSRYELVDTLKSLDRGAVIFHFHNVTPPSLWGTTVGVDDLERGQAGVSKLAPYADLIVTDSPFNAEDLVRDHGCAPGSVHVLPLAVPLDAFRPGPADPSLLRDYGLDGKRVILFVGRMAGNKRVDLLVEALPLVQRTVPNARLLIVGDSNSNPAFADVVQGIRKRATELGVADDVVFTGRVDDLPPHYRLADVYASASLHEGFGVPLIEAMASGVPLVVSNVTAHPWVAGEAGLLCAPENVEEMAGQITRVLTDDGLHGQLAKAGLERARDFSLEQFYAGWGKIVDEATAWVAQRPYRLGPETTAGAAVTGQTGASPQTAMTSKFALPLDDEMDQLAHAAGAVLRPHVVRSNVPVLGPLIVWTRRNLTSHLREPYLDPTLHRQETFNWLVVQTLRQVNRLVSRSQPAAAALDARTTQLENQMKIVLDYLAGQVEQARQTDDSAAREAALAALAEEIDRLRHRQNLLTPEP